MSDPTIPMYQRASDIKTLHLDGGCEASWVLKHLYPDETAGAVWFALGTAIHAAIEQVITNDLPLTETHAYGQMELDMLLAETDEVIEGTGKRNLSTVNADLHTLIDQWWETVHPTSTRRMPVYNKYQWPPIAEHEIELPDYGLYTTVDAIFTGNGNQQFGENVLVVDWKTGASKTAHPSQLQVYRFGLVKEGIMPEDNVIVGAFHHVAHENLQWVNNYVGDDVVEAWIQRTAGQKADMIATGTPVFNPQFLCNYCVSKPQCPIYHGSKTFEEIGNSIQAATLIDIPERVSQREGESDVF